MHGRRRSSLRVSMVRAVVPRPSDLRRGGPRVPGGSGIRAGAASRHERLRRRRRSILHAGWIGTALVAALAAAGAVVVTQTTLLPADIAPISLATQADPERPWDGTWTVQPGDGPERSFVGYRVAPVGQAPGSDQDQVGRTDAVTGTVVLTGDRLRTADVQADLTALTARDPLTDRLLRDQILATGEHPSASFRLREPTVLVDTPKPGQVVSLAAVGDLTLRGTTRPVTFDLEGRWNGEDRMEVVGRARVRLADHGINPVVSDLPGADQLDGSARVEFRLDLARA